MIKKIGKYLGIFLFVGIFIGICNILRMEERTSDKELIDIFQKANIPLKIIYEKGIRYSVSPAIKDSKTTILFLHGAPGSGSNYNGYMMDSTLRSKAKVMTMDRHGYDRSQYGIPELDIASQAKDIETMITTHIDTTEQVILVSHSYGGPVAAYLSYIIPDRVQAHIMLCPVIDPVSEPMFWFAGAPLWWPFRYISSPFMKVATHEKMTHPDELRKIEHIWKEVKVPTLMIQGAKDWLAPIANADYVKSRFNNATTEVRILEDESHFIPFNNNHLVKELIHEFLPPRL